MVAANQSEKLKLSITFIKKSQNKADIMTWLDIMTCQMAKGSISTTEKNFHVTFDFEGKFGEILDIKDCEKSSFYLKRLMMKSQPITAATEPESQNQAAKDKEGCCNHKGLFLEVKSSANTCTIIQG